jgi:hypothetical protein
MNDIKLLDSKPTELERSLGRLRGLARLMDDQFHVPIVNVRVGLDPIIGAIPGGGDWITWLVSIYILWEAMRLGAPMPVLLKMAWNLTVDVLVGYVPVIGDLADVAIKANRKNVDLVFGHFGVVSRPAHPNLVIVPPAALAKPKPNKAVTGLVVLLLTLVLFALASVPAVLIYWFFLRG